MQRFFIPVNYFVYFVSHKHFINHPLHQLPRSTAPLFTAALCNGRRTIASLHTPWQAFREKYFYLM
jgi:hypothetical protein